MLSALNDYGLSRKGALVIPRQPGPAPASQDPKTIGHAPVWVSPGRSDQTHSDGDQTSSDDQGALSVLFGRPRRGWSGGSVSARASAPVSATGCRLLRDVAARQLFDLAGVRELGEPS